MSQPTIKDVAKLAGVSISTVSRVMNESKPVSPEAKRKVLDAINKLGFKPNELARSLVMKKSNSIGILVKDIGIEYMAQIVRGIEEVGKMYNYDILLSSTYGELENEKKSVDFLYRKQVEGIILLSENIDPEIIVKIKEYGMPFILLDRYYKSNDYKTVSVDFKDAMEKMTEYLIGLGHKKIMYIKHKSGFDISEKKLEGYEKVMHAHQLKPIIVEVKGATSEDGYFALEDNLKQVKKGGVTAVMASNDALAIGAANYCYDHDIRIPDSLSISGYGNSKVSSLYRPRITTVLEPYYDIGAVAMRMLTKVLQKEGAMDSSIWLPTDVIERESTKAI